MHSVIISGFGMPGSAARLPEWERLLSSAARLQQILPEAAGVRQLIRNEPLETTTVDVEGAALTIPTEAEILRIKGVLILRRNATRDYLDFVALATHMGADSSGEALHSFDRMYPQESGESALQQLQAQLANPLPYDLDELDLSEYRDLAAEWQDWERVKAACGRIAVAVFDHVCEAE